MSIPLPVDQGMDSANTVFSIQETNSGGTAIQGTSFVGGFGVAGASTNGIGVEAESQNFIGLRATGQVGIQCVGLGGPALMVDGFSLFQFGDVDIIGNLIVAAGIKAFKIDHPLNPTKSYLNHFTLESSEVKNLYDGIVVLDAQGEATVDLPAWFEALNTDFRYQLTPIGGKASLYISREIKMNRFAIAGGEAGMRVAWQVTGIRHDASVRTNPVSVEEEKPEKERGYYLNPRAHGAPDEKNVTWARYPRLMQETKELRDSRNAKNAERKPSTNR